MAKDRRTEVIRSTKLNGIDFVEIATIDQKTLRVHFLNAVDLAGTVKEVTIGGGESIPRVPPTPLNDATDWSTDEEGKFVLTLKVDSPGDFSTYTLTLVSVKLDPYFAHTRFSFKALCDSSLDCATPTPTCPSLLGDAPPVDYLAKDFLSFRKALSDYSALRYPEWQERSEADLGMAMMEALCAVADDLSYTQDRAVPEAALETATQRRSLIRHARLVDYEPLPATAAHVVLLFEMAAPGPVPSGLLVSTAGPDGTAIYFETGEGLDDKTRYTTNIKWNKLTPYFFDDSERCLKAGATDMWVEEHGLGFDKTLLNCKKIQVLIETEGESTADPPLRQIVTLVYPPAPEEPEQLDPVFDPINPIKITHLFWNSNDALLRDRDLTRTTVKGNLVPATQGRRFTESFAVAVPPTTAPQLPLAIYRTGPNGSDLYQFTLGNSPLAWLAPSDTGAYPRPEIQLIEQRPSDAPRVWTWFRWLLDADAFDPGFTIDPVRFSRLAINSDRSLQMDYDGDQGDTIRFGDGSFGDAPEPDAVFELIYRVGGGRTGNVAPDSAWRIESPSPASAVTNPFAGTGGADPESPLSIQRQAPHAFRAVQYRAVRQQDYQDAAQTLDWVQRAGSSFRWTGSWLTVFTTPDPKGSAQVATDRQVELIDLLNRYRLAGYESYVPAPRYAALDLTISVCARGDAFRGDVYAAVLAALSTTRFPDGSTGFFYFDRFTFGVPLERSALEAAIQDAPGVGGVISIFYRRRGYTPDFVNMPVTVTVGRDEIILVENDPSRPEFGSLKISVEGGK